MMSRSANGGSDAFLNTITDEGLLAIEKEFGLEINREFLEIGSNTESNVKNTPGDDVFVAGAHASVDNTRVS